MRQRPELNRGQALRLWTALTYDRSALKPESEVMGRLEDYLLLDSERPFWLTYPPELIELVVSGEVVLTPWHLCNSDGVRHDYSALQKRLGRELIPFAHRQDREDLACLEKGRGQEILIIHDNTEPGWEDEGGYPCFADWLRAVRAEAKDWLR